MTVKDSAIVFWDIDGTLLSTGRTGLAAWEYAVREVVGAEIALKPLRMSGLTDPMIARRILEFVGQKPEPEVERDLTEAYCRALPACLMPSFGGVLPGVKSILDDLSARSTSFMALLTGNMESCAWAKLRCYGLAHYFATGGFGDDGFDRVQIGHVALERILQIAGDVDRERMFLVGDSPYDVSCGNRIGVRTIAVASGDHSLGELAASSPWWLLPNLPDPAAFLEHIGVDA